MQMRLVAGGTVAFVCILVLGKYNFHFVLLLRLNRK